MTTQNPNRTTAVKTATTMTGKGLLAALAIGALFATSAEAKVRAHNAPQALVPMQVPSNRTSDIYESFSGGRHWYANPDRDFASVSRHPFGTADVSPQSDASPF